MSINNHKRPFRAGFLYAGAVLSGLFLSVSCTEEYRADAGTDKICMDVSSVSARALNPGGDQGLTDLQNNCSGSFLNGFTQSIRIWGAMAPNSNKTKLTPVFEDVQLIYDQQKNSHVTQWNYYGPEVGKINGYIYQFRAYYPGESHSTADRQTLEYIRGSNASKLMLKYNTNNIQEDLLVATAGNTSNVNLQFQHALSALIFKFKSDSGEDLLTSCWIENGKTEHNLNDALLSGGFFGSVGSLDYGKGKIDDLDHTIGWKVNWRDAQNYRWETKSPEPGGTAEAVGIPFSGTSGTAYTSVVPSSELKTGGGFIANEGAVLIIPQTVTEDLFLCFTTRNNTQKNNAGQWLKPLVMKANLHLKSQPAKTFEPGKKYIYNVTLTGAKVTVTLTIKDWNEKSVSNQIEL